MSAGETINLTPTQERAADQVLERLAMPDRCLIVVEGLSGVGKTAVLQQLGDRVSDRGGIILEEGARVNGDTAEQLQAASHVITTATISRKQEYKQTARKLHKQIRGGFNVTHMVVLPGMNQVETKKLIGDYPETSLPPERIAYYSLGVPLLVRKLAVARAENEALGVAAHHLYQSFGAIGSSKLIDQAQRYLQMELPEVALQADRGWHISGNIYAQLYTSFMRQAELHAQGIDEESPLFVAPESEKIYDAMLRSDDTSSIDIFVPNMSGTDLARLQQAFGYDGAVTNWRGSDEYSQRKATRPAMFGADYRKVSFWHRDASGVEFEDENEYSELSLMVAAYRNAHEDARLGMQSRNEGEASMYIHSHEHDGMPWHTAHLGWMVESLLQQRGIPTSLITTPTAPVTRTMQTPSALKNYLGE